jgi:CPSF A subunit region
VLSCEQPSYQQPNVNAILRLDSSSFVQELGLSRSLLCVTDEQILISSLMLDSQAVPRRLETKGNPQRLTYSKHLNKIIVVLDELNFERGATLEEPLMKRKLRPALQFIDPEEKFQTSDTEVKAHVTLVGEPGDRVTSIMNWTPSDGQKHYEMIIIGIEADAPDTEHSSGRLLCMSAKQAGLGADLDVKPKYVKKFPGQPIYSLCPYDISSLLVSAGNDLVMMHLDVGARKWQQIAKFALPSPAAALTTRGSLIYAATMYHSMEIIECIKGKLAMHSSDLQARNANSIIACHNGVAIMSSASTNIRGGRITGFSAQATHHESQVIFQADLPLVVNNLKAGFTLPPDDSSRQCVYASTLDGTMCYLTTLNQDEWRLLHFLECLINQGAIGVTHRRRRQRRANTEPPKPSPEDMHIHGEIVAQLLSRGTQWVRNLLREGTDTEDSLGEIPESAEERQKVFSTLAQAVIGESEDPVTGVVTWLRTLIRN